MHLPISNNTGSLPDLTILQFPSPLTTPIDVEDQNYSGNSANLSPTSAHHMNMGPPSHPSGILPHSSPPPPLFPIARGLHTFMHSVQAFK